MAVTARTPLEPVEGARKLNDPICDLAAPAAPQATLGAGPPPRPWLVADIGGTNARFGWLDADTDRVGQVATLPTADYPDPADALADYLGRLARELGPAYRPPQAAAFAVATAVAGDRVAFTNSHWTFSRDALRQRLGLRALLVLNDFEALALSLPRLRAAQLQPLGPTLAAPRAPLAVVGPGTGLGVAGLLPTAHGWVALPGEGGHASLAPADDHESALLAAVRREHAHVSAERLLSGIGLPVLHAAVLQVQGLPRPAAPLAAGEIVERALAGSDAACLETVRSFCGLLGGFCGSVALTLGARGGLFVGGGIVPRLGGLFDATLFRQRFEAKGRLTPYLSAIPTALITDTLAALAGAALALEQLEEA